MNANSEHLPGPAFKINNAQSLLSHQPNFPFTGPNRDMDSSQLQEIKTDHPNISMSLDCLNKLSVPPKLNVTRIATPTCTSTTLATLRSKFEQHERFLTQRYNESVAPHPRNLKTSVSNVMNQVMRLTNDSTSKDKKEADYINIVKNNMQNIPRAEMKTNHYQNELDAVILNENSETTMSWRQQLNHVIPVIGMKGSPNTSTRNKVPTKPALIGGCTEQLKVTSSGAQFNKKAAPSACLSKESSVETSDIISQLARELQNQKISNQNDTINPLQIQTSGGIVNASENVFDHAETVHTMRMFSKLESENIRLKTEVNQLKSSLDAMKKEGDEKIRISTKYLQDELMDIQNQYQDVIRDLEQRVQLEEETRHKLNNAVEQLTNENGELKNRCNSIIDQLSESAAQIEREQHLNTSDGSIRQSSIPDPNLPSSLLHSILKSDISRKETLISQLVTQLDSISEDKRRMNVEMKAQRETLEEQRSHIQLLDDALKKSKESNAQDETLRVRNLVDQMDQMKDDYENKLMYERRLRTSMQQRLEQLISQQNSMSETENRAERDDGPCGGGGPDSTDMAGVRMELEKSQNDVIQLISQRDDLLKQLNEEMNCRESAVNIACQSRDSKLQSFESQQAKLIQIFEMEHSRWNEDVKKFELEKLNLQLQVKRLNSQLNDHAQIIRILSNTPSTNIVANNSDTSVVKNVNEDVATNEGGKDYVIYDNLKNCRRQTPNSAMDVIAPTLSDRSASASRTESVSSPFMTKNRQTAINTPPLQQHQLLNVTLDRQQLHPQPPHQQTQVVVKNRSYMNLPIVVGGGGGGNNRTDLPRPSSTIAVSSQFFNNNHNNSSHLLSSSHIKQFSTPIAACSSSAKTFSTNQGSKSQQQLPQPPHSLFSTSTLLTNQQFPTTANHQVAAGDQSSPFFNSASHHDLMYENLKNTKTAQIHFNTVENSNIQDLLAKLTNCQGGGMFVGKSPAPLPLEAVVTSVSNHHQPTTSGSSSAKRTGSDASCESSSSKVAIGSLRNTPFNRSSRKYRGRYQQQQQDHPPKSVSQTVSAPQPIETRQWVVNDPCGVDIQGRQIPFPVGYFTSNESGEVDNFENNQALNNNGGDQLLQEGGNNSINDEQLNDSIDGTIHSGTIPHQFNHSHIDDKDFMEYWKI